MKTSRISRLLIPLITLFGAAVGFFARRLQLSSELLVDGSLAPGSYLHVVLAVLALAVTASLAALLLPLRRKGEYADYFTPHPLPNGLQLLAALGLLVGNLALLSGGGEAVSVYTQTNRLSELLSGALALLGPVAAVCLAVHAVVRMLHRKPHATLYMIVSLYLAVRLVVKFQSWNVDPSIYDYCFCLLAAVCTMLSSFHLAGFYLGSAKRRLTLFWCLCSVFFCAVSLADAVADRSLSDVLIGFALVLFNGVSAVQLLCPVRSE